MVAAKATGKEKKMRTREIEVQFLYDERVVPPRCRSARMREQMGACVAELAEPGPEEAPVALVAHRPGEGPVEYRLFGHELYTREGQPLRAKAYAAACHQGVGILEEPLEGYEPEPISKDLPMEGDLYVRNERDCAHEVRRWSRERIVVDGELWRTAKEPRYQVGWNGALKVGESWITWKQGFSALESAEARAEAGKTVAKCRRTFDAYDSEAIERSNAETWIEVLIPEAAAYPNAAEAAEVRKLRAQLKTLEETLEAADAGGLDGFEPGLFADIAKAKAWKQVELESLTRELGKRYGRGTELTEDELDIAADLVIRNC